MNDAAKRRLALIVWAVMVVAYLGEVILLILTSDMPTGDPGDQASPWFRRSRTSHLWQWGYSAFGW